MSETIKAPDVYLAINKVQAELAKQGISKDRRNQQQNYSFRGIDDVYNALSPLLAEHGLVILPRCLARTATERETQKGGVLSFVVVESEFDFVAASDGSKHTVRTFGEAMDSADKGTNKAMSAAYKYAAFQAFAIPTEGEDNDADATTPPPNRPREPLSRHEQPREVPKRTVTPKKSEPEPEQIPGKASNIWKDCKIKDVTKHTSKAGNTYFKVHISGDERTPGTMKAELANELAGIQGTADLEVKEGRFAGSWEVIGYQLPLEVELEAKAKAQEADEGPY